MKIALFAHRFPSLSETFVADQVAALRSHGIDVHIYAHVPEVGATAAPDSKITHWPEDFLARCRSAARLSLREAARASVVWYRAQNEDSWLKYLGNCGQFSPPRTYDAILAHFGNVGVDTDLFRRAGLLRGPLCVVFHGVDITRHLVRNGPHAYDQLLKHADWLLPVSERWRDRLVELGADPRRIIVQRMGVDCQTIAFNPRSWNPADPLRIISVARLVEKKGLHVAIPAVAELVRSGRSVSWDVVGGGSMQEELTRLAQEHRLDVRFHGPQSRKRVAELSARAHVFLAPSMTASNGDQEGIPVAIMEAMAAGLLVVSTRHSGIVELVQDGSSGYLAQEGDHHDLLTRLRSACAEHARWGELQRAARATVERDFNQSRLNDELVSFLRKQNTW